MLFPFQRTFNFYFVLICYLRVRGCTTSRASLIKASIIDRQQSGGHYVWCLLQLYGQVRLDVLNVHCFTIHSLMR